MRQQDGQQYFSFSLRFRNAQVEAAYAEGRRPFLVSRTSTLACIYFLATGCNLLTLLAMRSGLKREGMASDVAHESFLVQALARGCVVAFTALVLLSRRVWERCFAAGRPVFLEGVVISVMAFSMLLSVFSSPTRYVKIRGSTLLEAFGDGYDSDSSILLVIDVFVTVAHLGLPVRWFVMAPLELVAVLNYLLVVLLIGSEEPMSHVLFNFVALVALVVAAALSKRSAELDERKSFLAMISEKALRCEVEFQLAQVTTTTGFASLEEARSEGHSETRHSEVTDRSGAIFDPLFEKGGDLQEQLQLVADKGDSEHWRIPAGDVKVLDEEDLGRGSYGSVKRALFCGMLVAVKCPRLDPGAMRVPELCNELRILRHLRHPHIVAAHGSVVMPAERQIYLVLELVEGPNLASFVLPADPAEAPSVVQRFQVMLGVCRALLYMHTRVPKIVHGDLKSGNILVDLSSGCAVPKVLDFGLSRLVSGHARALSGTLAWLAPEVLTRAPVRCSADIFSFGHVLAFTATGLPPMHNMSRQMVLRALQRKRPPPPGWPENCPFGPNCRALVLACLQPQPEQRPCVQELHRGLLGLSSELKSEGNVFLEKVRDVSRLLDAGPLDLVALCARPEPNSLGSVPEGGLATPTSKDGTSTGNGSSSSCSGSKRTLCWPCPDLPETSRAGMHASLMACLRRWNSQEIERACCERHALFRLCARVCSEALAAPCVKGPLPHRRGVQCHNCGVLELLEQHCDLCGWEGEEEPSEEQSGPLTLAL